jgi:hypothetical protein
MDLNEFFVLIMILMHWRSVVGLIVAGTFAYFLVHHLPWLTVIQGIGIALMGLIPGLVGYAAGNQKASESNLPLRFNSPSTAETTAAAAGASAFCVGAFWGLLSSGNPHSMIAGAIILIFAVWTWGYVAKRLQWLNEQRIFPCAFLAVLAYLISTPLAHVYLSSFFE